MEETLRSGTQHPDPLKRVKARLTLTHATDITMKPVHWLWDKRVATGTLVLLAGREGIGKSTLAYTLVADITRGTLPGIYEGAPKNVIVVATEDSWEFTIVPRLIAAGADLTKVLKVDPVDPDEYGISLPRDIEALTTITRESEVAMLLLDPLMSRVDSNLDTHKDSEVRQALEPLVRMAEAGGAAVLGIVHVNKSGSTDPLTTVMASRAFTAVSRAVLYVIEDPDDPNIKIMGQPKNNLGRGDLPSRTYSLHGVTVGEFEGEEITSVQLKWGEERAPRKIDEILSTKPYTSKADTAADWLESYLKQNGRTPSKTVKEAGELLGHHAWTLKRALKDVGVKATSEGFPRATYWELSEDE